MVCFTGDIADWGVPEEYAEARVFFEQLAIDVGVTPDRLFFVPGNHDICRGVNVSSWRKLRQAALAVGERGVSDWMAGGRAPFGIKAKLREEVGARQQHYRDWLESMGRSELLAKNSPHGFLGYRVSLELPGLSFPVHIIGLDTSWLAGDDHDYGKLMLTNDQIGRLSSDDQGAPLNGFRLALMHHPLTQLVDCTDARRILADTTDLLLRGHQHEPLADAWTDADRGLIELAAGSLYEGTEGHRYPNGYTLINIITEDNGQPKRYELRFRSWSQHGHWHDDSSLYRSAVNGRLVLSASRHLSKQRNLPISAPLLKSIAAMWERHRKAKSRIFTFHKLLLVKQFAPSYFNAVFESVSNGLSEIIERWLVREVERYTGQTEHLVLNMEDDRTLCAANVIAVDQGAMEVDIHHILQALLADEESNTIKALRKELNTGALKRYEELKRSARTKWPVDEGTIVGEINI
ncbi:putative phosphohydrolase [Pseudomonas sp. GM78]|nr:putative phosphohydrolase [Pseudomonas sp. GM78]